MQKQKINQYALTGFILAILSLVLNVLGSMSIFGLVFSTIGLTKLKGDDTRSKTLATIGVVLSIITLSYAIYAIVIKG